MLLKKIGLLLLLCLVTAGTQTAWAANCIDAQTIDIDNFQQVTPQIWRGAAPQEDGLEELAKNGFKTVVDLRMGSTENEAKSAERLGMRYVHIPLGYFTPSKLKVLQFLHVVNNTTGPIFVHCRRGEDRTGTLVGIYRVLVQGWSFRKAYTEMRMYHFKPWLVLMKHHVQTAQAQYSDVDKKLLVSQDVGEF